MSNDAAALALAAIALQRANEAERKADLAERTAFVKGYQHDKATLEERHYYADSVYELWPVESDPPSKGDRIFVALISLFALAVAVFGWFYFLDGSNLGDRIFGALFALIIAVVALAILFGIGMLIDYIFNFEGSFILLTLLAVLGIAGYLAFLKPYQYYVDFDVPLGYVSQHSVFDLEHKGLFGCKYNKGFDAYHDILRQIKEQAPYPDKVTDTCELKFIKDFK